MSSRALLPVLVRVLFVALLVLLPGCVPHTRAYRPVSSLEQQAVDRANRNVFPGDVRNAMDSYSGTMLAWPGVIVSSEFVEDDDGLQIKFLLEHHYYSWIEDFSIQRERIFLSPRGEGRFRTNWIVQKDTEGVRSAARPGTLLIVYGTPEPAADDGNIRLKASYIRAIDAQWYRTDVMDYGRPGEPVRLLRVPGANRR